MITGVGVPGGRSAVFALNSLTNIMMFKPR
jgi:hypothetical protein